VQRPGWSFVFAGDTFPWSRGAAPLRRLRSLPNCHLVGNLPYAELPALLKGLDVCLLPYVEDERAFYRSPLKLYEYLAAGRPVVATRHPEAVEQADWVFFPIHPRLSWRIWSGHAAITDQNASSSSRRLRLRAIGTARGHDGADYREALAG
jgi:hypothetical protein